MITIKEIRIDDHGDPSVGIFPSFWNITGEMNFEDEDDYKQFKLKLREAFEYLTDKPIISENLNNDKSITNDKLLTSIIKQLDRWIDDCEKQTETFQKENMEIAAMGSNAMAQAYWNVKQLIDVANNKI